MLRRVFAQPIEQMLALGCFCGGGVSRAPPETARGILEANCSWLPWLLWRLDEACGTGRRCLRAGSKDEAQ